MAAPLEELRKESLWSTGACLMPFSRRRACMTTTLNGTNIAGSMSQYITGQHQCAGIHVLSRRTCSVNTFGNDSASRCLTLSHRAPSTNKPFTYTPSSGPSSYFSCNTNKRNNTKNCTSSRSWLLDSVADLYWSIVLAMFCTSCSKEARCIRRNLRRPLNSTKSAYSRDFVGLI